jgi:uncharacterized protein YigE (DUF2233 family)
MSPFFEGRRICSGFAATLLLGTAWLVIGLPHPAATQTLMWDPVAEGLSVTVWTPQAPCQDVPPLVAIDIDPDRYRFAVHHYQREGLSVPPDIHQWQQKTGHELVFNAGLFREDYSYLGLLYANGRSIGSKRHPTWMGLFVAEPIASTPAQARVLDLAVDAFDEQQPVYQEAAQSLMLLDRTGKVRVRQTGKRAQQTILAELGNGHLLVLKSTVAVSLYAIGQCVRDTFPAVRQAMAMDGGSSSDVALSAATKQATSKPGDMRPWIPLLGDNSTAHIGLPAVIGISPRHASLANQAGQDKPAPR